MPFHEHLFCYQVWNLRVCVNHFVATIAHVVPLDGSEIEIKGKIMINPNS